MKNKPWKIWGIKQQTCRLHEVSRSNSLFNSSPWQPKRHFKTPCTVKLWVNKLPRSSWIFEILNSKSSISPTYSAFLHFVFEKNVTRAFLYLSFFFRKLKSAAKWQKFISKLLHKRYVFVISIFDKQLDNSWLTQFLYIRTLLMVTHRI